MCQMQRYAEFSIAIGLWSTSTPQGQSDVGAMVSTSDHVAALLADREFLHWQSLIRTCSCSSVHSFMKMNRDVDLGVEAVCWVGVIVPRVGVEGICWGGCYPDKALCCRYIAQLCSCYQGAFNIFTCPPKKEGPDQLAHTGSKQPLKVLLDLVDILWLVFHRHHVANLAPPLQLLRFPWGESNGAPIRKHKQCDRYLQGWLIINVIQPNQETVQQALGASVVEAFPCSCK